MVVEKICCYCCTECVFLESDEWTFEVQRSVVWCFEVDGLTDFAPGWFVLWF